AKYPAIRITRPTTTGAITQAHPSRPRYGPSVPTFVVGFNPGGRIVIFLRAIALECTRAVAAGCDTRPSAHLTGRLRAGVIASVRAGRGNRCGSTDRRA